MSALQDVATDQQTDVEIIEHLDFDAALSCEVVLRQLGDPLCGAPASWVLRARCCGFSVVMCAEHRAKWLTAARGFRDVACSRCGHREKTFDGLIEFIPIGGAS